MVVLGKACVYTFLESGIYVLLDCDRLLQGVDTPTHQYKGPDIAVVLTKARCDVLQYTNVQYYGMESKVNCTACYSHVFSTDFAIARCY